MADPGWRPHRRADGLCGISEGDPASAALAGAKDVQRHPPLVEDAQGGAFRRTRAAEIACKGNPGIFPSAALDHTRNSRNYKSGVSCAVGAFDSQTVGTSAKGESAEKTAAAGQAVAAAALRRGAARAPFYLARRAQKASCHLDCSPAGFGQNDPAGELYRKPQARVPVVPNRPGRFRRRHILLLPRRGGTGQAVGTFAKENPAGAYSGIFNRVAALCAPILQGAIRSSG